MPPAEISFAQRALWQRTNDQCRGDLEDVPFFTALALAQGPPVLELGCGAGRLLVPLALSGVFPAVGLDRSAEALAAAERFFEQRRQVTLHCRDVVREHLPETEFPELPEHLAWHLGDAADFHLEQRFRLICLCANSLTYVQGAARLSCLRCCREHLAEGGLLAFSDYGRPPVEEQLAAAGLEVWEKFGWFDLRPWTESAWHTVVLARRRSGAPGQRTPTLRR